MTRGRPFVTLDMQEAATVAFALRDEVRRLEVAVKRRDIPGLREAVESERRLFERIAARLAQAGIPVSAG